ncbi:Crp/Fnr family transcriptional regulator [Bradyrhizobium oligotrophicum]|uniref:Crp/Fnr family transcriptional regulator n=1 Tax=Bradyrhizobium TaxID=374 RepID=UPI0028E57497|nr:MULTISPECIES: Crp/Fnr family transcriptional regulator [unclassified Bradyrhizobium]
MNKAVLKAVLRRNKWFAGLSPSLADNILRLGRVRNADNSLIYSASDSRDGLIALVSGQVRLTSFSLSGNPSFLLISSPGSWIGVTSALDGRPYGYDAFAIGKAVLFHVSQERFEALINESNEYYSAFVRMVCDHLRVSMQNLIILRNRRPLHRLAQELQRLAERHGRQTKKGLVIDLRLSQEDLAVMIGVGRQTINRLLKSLEQDGIATAKYASVTIHDLEAIERLSSSAPVES